MQTIPLPDQPYPASTPADPNPEPAHPHEPRETPDAEPVGVPASVPEDVPPSREPIGVPATTPTEIPATPSTSPQPTA